MADVWLQTVTREEVRGEKRERERQRETASAGGRGDAGAGSAESGAEDDVARREEAREEERRKQERKGKQGTRSGGEQKGIIITQNIKNQGKKRNERRGYTRHQDKQEQALTQLSLSLSHTETLTETGRRKGGTQRADKKGLGSRMSKGDRECE